MTELYRSDPEKYELFKNKTSNYIKKLNKACDDIQINVSNMPTCIKRLIDQKCGCDDDCVFDFYKNVDFDKSCKKFSSRVDTYVHCPENFDDIYDIEEKISLGIDFRESPKIQNIIRNRLFTAVQKYNAICKVTEGFKEQKRNIDCAKKLIKSYCRDDKNCISKTIRDYNVDINCPKQSDSDTHEGLVVIGAEIKNEPKSIFDYIEFEDNRNNEKLMSLPGEVPGFKSADTIDFNEYDWDHDDYSSNIFKNDKLSVEMDFDGLGNDVIHDHPTNKNFTCIERSNVSVCVTQISLIICGVLGYKILKSKFSGRSFLSLVFCYMTIILVLILNEILNFY